MFSGYLSALVLMLPVAAAQSGVYGPATGHPKAGDPAPELVFSQVLSAPVAGSWTQANLSGQVTVVGFFTLTSPNAGTVAAWNEVVDRFAGKQVQFVWITSEDKRTLMPALARHPVKGWVLYDPGGASAKAFGLDMPVNVYIGPDGKIVGFRDGVVPDAQVLNAVLERRVVLTRPTPATITNFQENNLVALDSTPARMPRAQDYRPRLTPSETVHITPSAAGERGNFGGPDYWVLKGVTLKEAIEEIYGLNAIRIEMPRSLDNAKRYDFAMLVPQPEPREEMKERFKQALQEYFHLTAGQEVRSADVYVVSREPGRNPPVEKPTEFSGVGARGSSVEFTATRDSGESMTTARAQSLDAILSVADEGTIDDFCHDLEGSLDRPVVNETHLEGRYRIQVQIPAGSKANFLATLRERTGLVIRPGQRKITFLKFRAVDDRATNVGAGPQGQKRMEGRKAPAGEL